MNETSAPKKLDRAIAIHRLAPTAFALRHVTIIVTGVATVTALVTAAPTNEPCPTFQDVAHTP